jgi:hypothetical protein
MVSLRRSRDCRRLPTQIDNCFKLLDIPPLGARHPLTLHYIMALLSTDTNILVNAIYLRCLPEAMRTALADKAELPPFELAQLRFQSMQQPPPRLFSAAAADKYPLPNLQDLSTFLHVATIFPKIDLEKEYYHIPMNESDIPKMAIIIPFCLSELLFMPFGLTNAGQTFQNLMDSLFHSFPFIFIYLDGILVFSHSHSGHLSHLKTVLASLAANGPRFNSLSFGHLHWHSNSQFACPANSCFPCTH